jgi:hypothetical protein
MARQYALPIEGKPDKGDPRGMAGYIRETAKKYGIDPEVALKVARSEGLTTFQSSVTQKSGKREPSWGAFQLYTGGGLGNQFQKETGLDPSDPKNEKATIDYALRTAAKVGWGPWHGAKNTGIQQWEGIGGEASKTASAGTEPAAADTAIKGTDTSTETPQVAPSGPAAVAPADDLLTKLKDPKGGASEGLSEAISGLGAALTGASPSSRGNMYDAAPARSTVPIPVTPTPTMVPLVDPRAAEAQRQQLAMAMQRLNSGRLY